MIWLRKFVALLLVSLGAALVFLPFPNTMSGEKDREYVLLEIDPAPYTEESAKAEFGDSFISLSFEDMDAYPETREIVLSLMGESDTWCVPSAEWRALLADRSVADPEGLVYAFRDDLHQISNVEVEEPGPEGEFVCFVATLLGAYDNRDYNPITWLEAGDLDDYPELNAELERMAGGPVPGEGGAGITPRQWRRFHDRELNEFEYRPPFVVFDRLFYGTVDTEVVPWNLQAAWLRQVASAVGVVFVFCGLVLAARSYRGAGTRPGIPISSPWLTVFCDVISLVGALFFVPIVIDTLWVGPLGQPSLIGLNPEWLSTTPITGLHFVSVTVFLIAFPLLTLWFTSLSHQRIEVNDGGVTSHGAIGSISIPWQDFERVHVREQKNPFSFSVVDFRKLQTVLDLEGEEHSVTINEPSSRKRKRQIMDALRRFAPEEKKEIIRDIEGVW